MAQYLNMDTLRFLLKDVHQFNDIIGKGCFQDYDEDSINIFLDSIKDFSDKLLYPTFQEMDEHPVHYKDGKIITHPKLGEMIQQAADLGLMTAPFKMEDGGMDLPATALNAAYYIMEAANNHVPGYFALTTGSANLIATFGTQELKDKFLPQMQSGEWAGTMCLTEPQAGSSLSDVTTSASPNEDGSYQIKGQKIFISGGDHEHLDNFVHLVLARIDGAPAGTKGISLFAVPKNRKKADGTLEFNDVITAGDFQKLGQKGYATTHLSFGESNDSKGWIVGKPNNGLRYMFQMMNEARISVGRGAAAIASAAYYASLQYANERPQGRKLTSDGSKNVNEEQTLIINHPDVRRMLLLQKAISEGALSLILQGSIYHDQHRIAETAESKENYHLLIELLTPMIKTYPSEMGKTAVDNGLQILGGYGFCSEFILQQYYRDIRIFSIYEGTTGIQSLDLLGRKVTMKGGKAVQALATEVQKTIMAAMAFEDLKPYATILAKKLGDAQKVMSHLIPFAMKGNYERYLSDATLFMEFLGTIVVGWQWLKMGVSAKQQLAANDAPYSATFYESKIHTLKFYYKYEMPKTSGLMTSMMDDEVLTIGEATELFV